MAKARDAEPRVLASSVTPAMTPRRSQVAKSPNLDTESLEQGDMKTSLVSTLICTVAVGLLSACATTEQQIVEPSAFAAVGADITAQLGAVQAPADKALIYLYRPERFGGSANTYRITLNDTPVADMRIGTRLAVPVLPGPTTLQGESMANILNIGLAFGMMEKPNIAFETEAGRVYFIDVKTGFAGGPKFEFVDATTGLEAIESLKLAEPPKLEE